MSFYGKVYKYEKQDNYDEFVEALGLPEDRKNFILNYKPDQRFEKDGDGYIHVLYINDVEKSVPFKVGEEFGNTIKTTEIKNLYTVEGDSVTQLMKFGASGELVVSVKKVFDGDKCVETITCNAHDVTATRYYSA